MPEQKYTRSDTSIIEPANAPPRIDEIRVRFPEDSDGCPHEAGDCDAYDADRTVGCIAEAHVSYSLGGGTRRLETLQSGGLWGICEDEDARVRLDYRREVASEELSDLKDHLAKFGVVLDDYDKHEKAALDGVKA